MKRERERRIGKNLYGDGQNTRGRDNLSKKVQERGRVSWHTW